MKHATRLVFIIILLYGVYHLLRDIAQIFEINNALTQTFHLSHTWCSTYCDYVTIPLELFQILGSSLVLHRKNVGILGRLVLLSLLLWPLMQWLP